MMISIRVDEQTERMLARLVRITGRTRSDVIRDAVRRLAEQAVHATSGPTAYDRFADVIGTIDLGPGDRAARSEELLRAMFARQRR